MVQNLDDIAQITRRAAIWLIVGIIGLILLWLVYKGGVALYKYLNPPTESHNPFVLTDGTKVDKLPPLKLPARKASFNGFEPKLDNPGATPPAFPKFFNFYKMSFDPASLLGVTRTEDIARAYRIESRGVETPQGKVYYANTNKLGLSEELVVDPRLFNYSYKTDYKTSRFKFEIGLPSEDVVSQAAKSFLSTYRAAREDLISNPAEVNYYRLENGLERKVASGSEANIVKVTFTRGSIKVKVPERSVDQNGDPVIMEVEKDIPIINSEKNGLVSITYGKIKESATSFQTTDVITELNLTHKHIDRDPQKEDEEKPNNYPILTGTEAWEKFKGGGAALVMGEIDSFKELEIKDISIAFYDSLAEQDYLQPVIVFSGEGILASADSTANTTLGRKAASFVAIMQALRPEYVDESKTSAAEETVSTVPFKPATASSQAAQKSPTPTSPFSSASATPTKSARDQLIP